MTDEELRALSTLEAQMAAVHKDMQELNNYIRDQAIILAGKVAVIEVKAHAQGSCPEVKGLRDRLRNLELRTAALAGTVGGVVGGAVGKLLS